MKKRTKENLQITGLGILAFIVIFLFLKYTPAYTECLTESYCVSSHQNLLLLSFVYWISLIAFIASAIGAWMLSLFALAKGYIYHLGGTVMLVIGALGIIMLFKTTPADQINDYLHIIGIGSFFTVFGIILLVLGLKGHGKFFN